MTWIPLLFVTALSATADPDLTWRPKRGEQSEFMLSVVSKGRSPMELEAHLVQKVLSVRTTDYLVETWAKSTLIRMGGEEIRDQRESRQSVTYGKRGEVLKLSDGEKKEQWIYAVARGFVAPPATMAVGGNWQFEYVQRRSFEGARISYSYKKLEKTVATIDFRVNGSGRERPEIGAGVWEIDTKTGRWLTMSGWVMDLLPESGKTQIRLKRL